VRRRLPHFAAFCLIAVLYLAGAFEFIEYQLFDVRFRTLERPAQSDLVIVAIDPKCISEIGVWPWPRELHADLVDDLIGAGTRQIALDIDFSSRSNTIADARLAGGFEIEEEHFTARSPNLTPDVETGIGAWNDQELITAIREGLRPYGSLIIGPPMPFSQYRGMSDRDVRAIIAYLRSVPEISNRIAESEYRMPLPPAYGPPVGHVEDVSPDDQVAYGRYLAGPLAHCMECHTPMEKGRFDYGNRNCVGGFPIPPGGGASVLTGNITPDRETGVGGWSDDDIKKAITRGLRPDGSQIHPIMPYRFYTGMKSKDVNAIIAYLRSIPAVRNQVK